MGIQTHHFSCITDSELDVLVQEYQHCKPSSGLCYIRGWLFSHRIQVQKEQVRLSVIQVNGLHQRLQYHEVIDRRDYEVPWLHALWHMDGHHKLIQWGLFVHGIIAGYS